MLHDSRMTENPELEGTGVWEMGLFLDLATRSQWICPKALRELRLDVDRNRN